MARLALLSLAALVLLKWTSSLVLPMAFGLLLFLLLSPWVEALQARGTPAAAASAGVVLLPTLLFGMAGVWAAPGAWVWWQHIVGRASEAAAPYLARPDAIGLITRSVMTRIAPPGDAGGAALHALAPVALACAPLLMLVFFMLLGQRDLLSRVLAALPDRRTRVRALGALRDARAGVVNCLVVMTVVNLGLTLATVLVLTLLGTPGAFGWSIAIFLLLFIPYIGPLAITLLLVADNTGTARVAAPALFLAMHGVEAHVISPWWTGRRLALRRPALLVAVIVGAWAGGLMGGLLAVPLLVVVQALQRHVPGGRMLRAWLAAESAAPPTFAAAATEAMMRDTGAGRIATSPAAGLQVHRMPTPPQSPLTCTSPTSPKPTRLKSMASP